MSILGVPQVRATDLMTLIHGNLHVCQVCKLLDNDVSLKECEYCSLCKAWICKKDKFRPDRRTFAMLKKEYGKNK